MKRQMATSTSTSGSPSTQSSSGIGSLNDGHGARSDENLFHNRDREKSISSSDSFDSKGRLVKKHRSKDQVCKTSSDKIRKVSSGSDRDGYSPLSAKSKFGSNDLLSLKKRQSNEKSSHGWLDLKNASSKDVKGNTGAQSELSSLTRR